MTQTDNFINGSSNFYEFNFSTTCLAYINIKDAPIEFRVAVYDNASTDTRVLQTSYIDPGEDFEVITGPLSPGKHYIQVEPRYQEGATSNYNIQIVFDCTDEDEPNNTFNSATEIKSDGTEYSGKILAVNDAINFEDYDMISFNNSGHDVIKMRFTAPENIFPINSDIQVSLYNEANDATILTRLNIDKGETIEDLIGPLEPGKHYIAINYKGECNCQSDKEYTISVELDKRDKQEPNDSPVSSTTIQLNREYTGTLVYPHWSGDLDRDWFKFTPSTNGIYTATLTGMNKYVFNPRTPRTFLYFYNTPGGTPQKNIWVDGKNVWQMTDLQLERGKDYYFLVTLNNWSDESDDVYTLKIQKQ